MKIFLFALLSVLLPAVLPANLLGEGPRFSHKDSITDREFENVYQDLRAGRVSLSTYLPLAGGTMTGVINMGGNVINNLSPATTSQHAARFSQVKIIQVVTSTTTSNFSTTSNTYQNTNLSASITPSSTTSTILVFASGVMEMVTQNVLAVATLANNTTAFGTEAELLSTTGGEVRSQATLLGQDAPGSVSAQTYRVRLKNSNNVSTAKFGENSRPQIMVLMEVNGL